MEEFHPLGNRESLDLSDPAVSATMWDTPPHDGAGGWWKEHEKTGVGYCLGMGFDFF